MWRAWMVLVVGGLAACGPTVAQKVVTPADLKEPARTKITTALSSPSREGASVEETPSTIVSHAVHDEAVIQRLSAGEACIALVERTHIMMDLPLASWKVTVDGNPVSLAGEQVSVRDYPCTGDPPREVVKGLSQEAFAKLRVGEPKEIAFRVVERRVSGCFPRNGNADRVRITLVLPAADRQGDWAEAFEWRIRR
jgi:hypothetical protein